MLGVVRAQPDPADVVRRTAREIDPPEAERAVDGVQRGEQPRPLRDQDVPLQPGLHGLVTLRERVPDRGLGVTAQHVDARVQSVDEFLLATQFIVWKFGV